MNYKKDDRKQLCESCHKDRFQSISHKSAVKTKIHQDTHNCNKDKQGSQNPSFQNFNSIVENELHTSLAFGYSTTGFSNKPTDLLTFSSSANHSSCTLLTLLHIQRKYKFYRTSRHHNAHNQGATRYKQVIHTTQVLFNL